MTNPQDVFVKNNFADGSTTFGSQSGLSNLESEIVNRGSSVRSSNSNTSKIQDSGGVEFQELENVNLFVAQAEVGFDENSTSDVMTVENAQSLIRRIDDPSIIPQNLTLLSKGR